jgi:hypothetical protein
MPVRDFIDSRGRQWRAWEITPESVEPQTKAEDYLADCYRGGWVVFETPDGQEKRRLCPLPFAWHERPDAQLERMLDAAEVIRPRRMARRANIDVILPADLPPNVPPSVAADIPRDPQGDIDMSYLGVVRSFMFPGGRLWSASVVRPDGGGPAVLRFMCGSRTFDLTEWPADWVDFNDDELGDLLRSAVPRDDGWLEGMPQRRQGDPLRKIEKME